MLLRFQLLTLLLAFCTSRILSQDIPVDPLRNTRDLSGAVAIPGAPFGVLRLEVPLPPLLSNSSPRILVENNEGRVFYPVVSVRSVEVEEELRAPAIGRPGGLFDRLRTAVRGEKKVRIEPVAVTVYALYTGTEPIELTLAGDINQKIRLESNAPTRGTTHQQLLASWWNETTKSARQVLQGDDFPKLVHKYLTSMLARRLGVPAVDLDPPDPDRQEMSQPLKTLALLAAIEPMRDDILEDVLNSPSDASEPRLPPPVEPIWEQAILPPIQANVSMEALASRAPPECLYLRFGSFANYVWFQEIAERYGGDLAQSVLLRGLNYEASPKMERMLASKLTTIAKMFGDQLVGDMAVVASDLYMKEGASVGVIFFATNPKLLIAAMEADRKAVMARNPDATLSQLTIEGKTVSLLSTPDNRIRSFATQDGPYVFVSTSKTLVRRFLEVGNGATSLADTQSFRWARTWMPDENEYAVFGYLSPDFFHRLVSPQYQIELRRRLSAIAHLEIAEMASLAAIAEGNPNLDIEGLQSAGFLPPWFDNRTDGSRTLKTETGWIDSARGARGSFLPIADVEISSVSQREAAGYATIASFYQNEWRHMDPMLFGLRRFRAQGSPTEQVAIEAYIAPFEPQKYGWIARQLGAPTPIELQLPADDAVSVQLHVKGSNTLGISSDDYHLFGGVKDMIPPNAEDTKGLIRTLQALKASPAYIGGWPKPGIIEQLPLGLGQTRPDAAGFSRLLGGLWRWDNGELSLLSFNRSIIEQAIPHVKVTETQDLAQARARVADLTGSQLSTWINRLWYERGWRSSHGNAVLLDAIHQQLRIPAEQCLPVAEKIVDARLQCPLGGSYQFENLPQGTSGWWISSAWSEAEIDEGERPVAPASYSAPWLDWFRGARIHVTQGPNSLSLVGTVDLEMPPLAAELTPSLPSLLPPLSFDLFGLPMKLFGGAGSPAEKTPATKSF